MGGFVVRAFMAVMAVAEAAGAASDRGANPVWPPPPAKARIAYVRSLYGPADLGVKPSGLSRLGHILAGADAKTRRFGRPFGIALDEAGNLCLTDMERQSVLVFDQARKKVGIWDRVGALSFRAPVAVARRAGIAYVADSELGAVVAFDDEGRVRFELREGMRRPCGLAVAGDRLFVADAAAESVAVFSLAGKPLARFGQRGAGPDEFNHPTHLAAGPGPVLLVTDSLNCRVGVYDLDGHARRTVGRAGDATGTFTRPKGVAMDRAGRIYVVDAAFDNLQVFDAEGRLLLHLGGTGSDPGRFWLPNGIAAGEDGRLFVTDSYNRRVQEFRYVGPPEPGLEVPNEADKTAGDGPPASDPRTPPSRPSP